MPKILVVEDEPGLRFVFQWLLGDAGHQVRVTGHIREAMAAIEAEVPDLILLDFLFPGGIRGDVLLDWLVSRGTLPDVILVSGQEGTRYTRTITYPRLAARFGKPFDTDALLEAVEAATKAVSK